MEARSNRDAVTVPGSIESAEAKLVYVYLATYGETTAAALSAALSLPQLSVRSVVSELSRRGLVERAEDGVRISSN